MSTWVCSARKFVVSSFVTFAEEMEHAVLVLTDVEKVKERELHLQLDSPPSDDTRTPIMGALASVQEASVFLLDAGLVTSESSPLTTQPAPRATILPSTSSMTSLPSMCSSSRTSSTLSKSSRTYHSLPDVSNSSDSVKRSSSSWNLTPSKSKSSNVHSHHSYVHRSRYTNAPTATVRKTGNVEEGGITILTSNPNANRPVVSSCTTTALVVHSSNGSKRKNVGLFSLKRPGKVVRTSTNEQMKSEEEEEGDSHPSSISFHVIEDSHESSPHSQTQQAISIIGNKSSSPSSGSLPEDLSIPNRSMLPALRDCNVEPIQRVSLVDKLSHMIHSTLVSISNLLRLEPEDITTICRSARSSRSLQIQAKEDLGQQTPTDSDGKISSLSRENGVDDDDANSPLALSRINSLVSMESFEILSKEDDVPPLLRPSVKRLDEISCPSEISHISHTLAGSPLNDRDTEQSSDVEMASSIEFIHFEVSDLITKRYFDSKKQRLEGFPPGLTLLPLKENPDEKDAFFQMVEPEEVDECNAEADSQVVVTESMDIEDEDDGSSVSFEVISEDACKESISTLH